MTGSVKDPVCGKDLAPKPETIPYTSTFDNRVYSFCSYSCKSVFDRNPERYARKEPADLYCYSCSSGKSYHGSAFYLFIGLVIVIIAVVLLGLWFR